ncbi:hypothetical protein CEXT_97121 [Caerostris extrusa]|uniref:Uncharacterized protein n=1 Tax=Caerostris extrusa TaxID=172846 RepID=A0AAV4NE06_CAEEX|nr:hypothetical protein CEXT_97121 [Caerostris extrusa]
MQPTDHLVKIEKKILEEKKISPSITSEYLPEIAEDTRKISISKIISESEKENLKDLKISQPTISTDHLAKVEKKDSEQQKIVPTISTEYLPEIEGKDSEISKEIRFTKRDTEPKEDIKLEYPTISTDHLIKEETRPTVLLEKYIDAQKKGIGEFKRSSLYDIYRPIGKKISKEEIAKSTISSEYSPEITEEISEVTEKMYPIPTSEIKRKKTPSGLLETEIEEEISDVSKERLQAEPSVDILEPQVKAVKDSKSIETTISTDHSVQVEKKKLRQRKIAPTFSEHFQKIKKEILAESKETLPIMLQKEF